MGFAVVRALGVGPGKFLAFGVVIRSHIGSQFCIGEPLVSPLQLGIRTIVLCSAFNALVKVGHLAGSLVIVRIRSGVVIILLILPAGIVVVCFSLFREITLRRRTDRTLCVVILCLSDSVLGIAAFS